MKNLDLRAIELAPLSALLSRHVDSPVKLSGTVKTDRNDRDYLWITSNELSEKAGVMSVVFKDLRISGEGFPNEVERKLVMRIYFSYELREGGSNGNPIGFAYYDLETETWTLN